MAEAGVGLQKRLQFRTRSGLIHGLPELENFFEGGIIFCWTVLYLDLLVLASRLTRAVCLLYVKAATSHCRMQERLHAPLYALHITLHIIRSPPSLPTAPSPSIA